MLINKVVDFCNDQFLLHKSPSVCPDCKHLEKCSGGCKQCLTEIHFPSKTKNGKKDYDCRNLLNFYICDYSFKYASEIWYLLNSSKLIEEIDNYNILSIGCGGCPDLMAFDSYISNCSTLELKTISYLGIEKNELWKPIHDQISRYRNERILNTKYKYIDIFDCLAESITTSTNVLILQYLISHFYSIGQARKIDELFESLATNIAAKKIKNKPFVIIINDVNSKYRGRDKFMSLCSKLITADLHEVHSKYYFNYGIQYDGQKYGNSHSSSDVLYDVPDKLIMYNPWKNCSSAQLLIELN